jgi:TrwC relaxase
VGQPRHRRDAGGVRHTFPKRHEQIAAELERQEAQGKHRTAKLVQTVVHATRPPKSQETPETLYGRWRQEARELGMSRNGWCAR